MKKLPQQNIKEIINLFNKNNFSQIITKTELLKKEYPNEVFLFHIMGMTYYKLNQLKKAELNLKKATHINNNFIQIYNDLANVLAKIGKAEESIQNYKIAINKKPNFVEAHNNLASVLANQNRVQESIESYKNALRYKPNYIEALNNLGFLLKSIGCISEAQDCYKKAFTFSSKNIIYEINRMLLIPPISDSNNQIIKSRDSYVKGLKYLEKYNSNKLYDFENILPQSFFLSYHAKDNLNILKKSSKLYRKILSDINYISKNTNNNKSQKKIKVGYVSQFLTFHTIGKLFGGIIKNLNKNKFEVFVFHNKETKSSELKNDIDKNVYKSITLGTKIDDQQKQIEKENLDILFYTDIGMSPSSYFLAFSKLAPVQIVTWGHPETTGIDTIDYFLSSTLLESKNSEKNYSENLILLDTFPIYYEPPKITGKLKGRGDLKLPLNNRLYGCPQSLFKLHPDFDSVLSEILKKDKKGILVFIGGKGKINYWVETLKKRWSKKFPIIIERSIFLDRLNLNEFISLCNCVDVLLDPFYFGGGNSFLESMVVGTPTVTMPGKNLRENITAAAYKQMEIKDSPIVKNKHEYIELAIKLANNEKLKEKLKKELKVRATKYLFKNLRALKTHEIFLEEANNAYINNKNLPDGKIIK